MLRCVGYVRMKRSMVDTASSCLPALNSAYAISIIACSVYGPYGYWAMRRCQVSVALAQCSLRMSPWARSYRTSTGWPSFLSFLCHIFLKLEHPEAASTAASSSRSRERGTERKVMGKDAEEVGAPGARSVG